MTRRAAAFCLLDGGQKKSAFDLAALSTQQSTSGGIRLRRRRIRSALACFYKEYGLGSGRSSFIIDRRQAGVEEKKKTFARTSKASQPKRERPKPQQAANSRNERTKERKRQRQGFSLRFLELLLVLFDSLPFESRSGRLCLSFLRSFVAVARQLVSLSS